MGQPALDTDDRPLDDNLHDLEGRMKGRAALQDLRRGLRAYHEGDGELGYEMFVSKRR